MKKRERKRDVMIVMKHEDETTLRYDEALRSSIDRLNYQTRSMGNSAIVTVREIVCSTKSCKHVEPSVVKINLAFSQDDPLSSICCLRDSDVFDVSIWISDLSNCELRSSSCRI